MASDGYAKHLTDEKYPAICHLSLQYNNTKKTLTDFCFWYVSKMLCWFQLLMSTSERKTGLNFFHYYVINFQTACTFQEGKVVTQTNFILSVINRIKLKPHIDRLKVCAKHKTFAIICLHLLWVIMGCWY